MFPKQKNQKQLTGNLYCQHYLLKILKIYHRDRWDNIYISTYTHILIELIINKKQENYDLFN